jgi:hypothetical protein
MEGYFVTSLPTRYIVSVVHVYFVYIEVVTRSHNVQLMFTVLLCCLWHITCRVAYTVHTVHYVVCGT